MKTTSNIGCHLCMVCPGCGGTGAVANVAIHQARELARYFRVSLLSDSFPAIMINGVEFHPLKPFRFNWMRRYCHVPNEIAFALCVKSSIVKLHKQAKVDIILCHGHSVAALAARPLRRRVGIPYAMVTHGDIFDRPKGTYDQRLTWFYRQVTRPAYKSAGLVVALSPHMREMAIRGGAAPAKVVVIPNGIDPTEIGIKDKQFSFSRESSSGRLELLYVGRLSVEKSVDVLIDAAKLLKEKGFAFRLRVAGDGPEKQNLRSTVARSKLDDVVEFLGQVPRLRLGALYRSADLVCVPSRSDPLPTVVLEAMAAGVAVVGADTGGIPYMVRNGKTGMVVPRENPVSLADMFERISTDRMLLQGMSYAAMNEAKKRFSWNIVTEQLTERLTGIISDQMRCF